MVRSLVIRLLPVLILGLATVGCSSEEADPPVSDMTPSDDELAPDAGSLSAAALEYMTPCDITDDQCDKTGETALICFGFNMKGAHCTHTCEVDPDCPEPSPGCNGKGVCKAPD